MSETVETVDSGRDADAKAQEAEANPADGSSDATSSKDASGSSGNADSDESALVREGDVAGDYLERLLDLLDYDGDIDLDVEQGRAVVSIDGGTDLENLIGSHGGVLESLQELTRLAVQQETGARSRLMLDIAGWRARQRDELTQLGRSTAESVLSKGEAVRLRPMSPFERKIVHDAVAAVDGVRSDSEGDNPKRRVVVHPE